MPDDVEVRYSVVVGGELGDHLYAVPVEPLEERPGLGVLDPVEVYNDALIDRAVVDAVAVALDHLQDAVREGVRQARPRPEAVGDREEEPLLPLLLG